MAETRKGAITLKGNPLDLVGPELKAGDKAPDDFTLIGTDMAPVTGKDLAGKARILCAVPSLDTPVCDVEMKRFNEEAANLNLEVIAVSVDLPFAQKRWCGATGSDKIKTLSDWKFKTFGAAYGVEAPTFGLLARAVFVIGADDVVRHVEYVPEIGQEPNYGAALEAAKAL
ncbi:MAG: thiol peroxidase [Polyangiaceae bacterium]